MSSEKEERGIGVVGREKQNWFWLLKAASIANLKTEMNKSGIVFSARVFFHFFFLFLLFQASVSL